MKTSAEEIDGPIRGEIFSVERLQEYASYLASELTIGKSIKVKHTLLSRMDENGKILLESYKSLTEAIHKRESISPAGDWLVDNFHIVEDQLREIREDLSPQFYKELPKIAIGDLAGFPRVYALALALVAHTDSRLEINTISKFIQAFQGITPLNIGELWALAITLRLVLVENLRRVTQRIQWDRLKTAEANTLVDQLTENIKNENKVRSLASKIPKFCREAPQIEYSFVAQLAKRLRDQESEFWPASDSLEKHLGANKLSIEQVVHTDHQLQASNQITIANVITSMRLLSSMNWQDFFETLSVIDQVLREDPDGSYQKMDFSTRNQYRDVIEKIAKTTGSSEVDVAGKVIQLAKKAKLEGKENKRLFHVGYYLIGKGVILTKRGLGEGGKANFFSRTFFSPIPIYFGVIGLLCSFIYITVLYYGVTQGASKWLLVCIAFLTSIPVSELVISITNLIFTNAVRPKHLPKLDFSLGVPPSCKTMVVVPCLLTSIKVILELLEKIEIHYLGNNDPQFFFALLTDLPDSEKEILPDDAILLKTAEDGIGALNQKYASQTGNIFFLFHRARRWNHQEKTWMGWERKRGKIEEFNHVLRGAQETSFSPITLPREFLFAIRFVITLDADTKLPRDAARKMVGTIMHPLNQAFFDHNVGRVTEGYGVLQPRISISLESSARSNFSKIFSGYVGMDPYTTAVSDIYQDLFSEGSYTGKGLYDVDAFELALKGRVPENTILSHDLLEGLFARAALATDIELFDDYPQSYEAFVKRQHRWIRGDWQIAPWILPFVSNQKKNTVRNNLPALAKWKIFDNLRRSLVGPFTFFWIFAAWVILPGNPLFWTSSALIIAVFPCITYFANGMITGRSGIYKIPFSVKWPDIKTNLSQVLLYLVFLPHQAYVQLDAISRALYRSLISKKKTMEWATAAQSENQSLIVNKPSWQTYWLVEFFLISVASFIFYDKPTSFAMASPLLLLWISHPLVAKWLSRETKQKQLPLAVEERELLRNIARRTWNYFETFAGPRDNHLPPDNYQEDPVPMLAHRTSPTNMGLYALSLVAVRDLGYITTSKFIRLLNATLDSMNKLERYDGHFFNWYDTNTLQPLIPKYISTVDSGNLAGCLIAVRQACLQVSNLFVIDSATGEGLNDTLTVIDQLIRSKSESSGPSNTIILSQKILLRVEKSDQNYFSNWDLMLVDFMKSIDTIKNSINPEAEQSEKTKEIFKWIDSLITQVLALQEDLVTFSPCTTDVSSQLKLELLTLPSHTRDKWNNVISGLDKNKSFYSLSLSYDNAIRALEQSVEPLTNVQLKFVASLKVAKMSLSHLISQSDSSAHSINQITTAMNFKFLIDEERDVFSIGFNVTDAKHDGSLYDLLGSESRLASFVAIAKGDVNQEHWFKLGRQLVPAGRSRALVSWTASMFEYLMPLLVMRDYKKTILDETYNAVVAKQISYGKEHRVPWGVSEAGYNARDLQFNYQYGPFGIPGLGLKRGLSHDLVISPYSTLLAAMIDSRAAIKNLKLLIDQKLLREFGFYEATDYTADRRPENQPFAIIKSFMAHHQGMSLVSIDNVLNNNIMQNRFHRDPSVRATQLLLQERIPRGINAVLPKAAEVELQGENRANLNSFVRQYTDPSPPSPRLQVLSNGNYSVMVSTAGSGYSKCNDKAVTRWREDATRDNWGNFIFVKNVSKEKVWSTGYQPTSLTKPETYKAIFGEEKIEFRRRDGDISTYTEIIVAPEDNVEIRHVTLTNHSMATQTLELTSYLEPVLAPLASDMDHPAFSKLFIETEFLNSKNALLAKRRKASNKDRETWAVHVVVSDHKFSTDTEYETDRSQFIGRGRSLINPIALASGFHLSNTIGATLDPILSLRVQIQLSPGEATQVTFSTGIANSHEEALELSDRYHDANCFERESKLAWTKSQVDMRHLNIDADSAYMFQRLAERIIYSDASLRPPSHQLEMNTRTQSSLWPHGISGDLPIVSVSISDPRDSHAVRKLLRCHEYLRLKGVSYDLVILNEFGATYFQELQDELHRQIRSTGSQTYLCQRGGVFILRSDITPMRDRAHIQAVARVSLFADQPLKEQVERKFAIEKIPPLLSFLNRAQKYENQDLPVPQTQFFNGFGGFNEDGREYVVTLGSGQWTPAPWINVIGNDHAFGFQISETGAGFTWSVNSQENRLTPWSNDPVSDPLGEIIYLRDEKSGAIWNPTPLPIRESSNYIIKHGVGYTSFEHISNGIYTTLTSFVPKDETVKISILKLKNLTKTNRKISVTSYTEWVLGSLREKSAPNLICAVDAETGAIFARNPYDDEFADRIAFADISENIRTHTCSRKEFLGRNGNYSDPAALRRDALTGKIGTGQDPCAVLQTVLEFGPGQEREIIILLGQCDNIEKARALSLRYRNLGVVRTAFDNMNQSWNNLVSAVQVKTPDPSTDLMLNSWLFYQALSCRFWSRTAFYQSGGAYGFRDQLQDSMAFIYSTPSLTREHILRAAGRQFVEGDVQHWWHPPSGRGIRTRMSDDLLWLPFVVSFYINVTGDNSVLEEVVPFLKAPLLLPGQADSYTLPDISKQSGSIFEHCLRAIDHSLEVGSHGLPLIGTGDWNDGMNLVGSGGKGESVWLGWFLYKVLNNFLPLCQQQGQTERVGRYSNCMKNLKQALATQGWDGEWYRRAYFDDGTPLGSHLNAECKIDSIAQSWSVLSGAGSEEQTEQALKKAKELLIKKDSGLALLLTPAFDKSAVDPGYIKGYVPGVRENGGQYTHAATWLIMAFAEKGDGQAAFDLFKMLNPINHALNQKDAKKYKIEPYVVAGDVYAGSAYEGRGGWSWYTGSASWYYRAGIESILGFDLRGKILRIKPCIPKEWRSYEIIYTFGKSKYYIKIENPHALNRGDSLIELDGVSVIDGAISLVDDAKDHKVTITLQIPLRLNLPEVQTTAICNDPPTP